MCTVKYICVFISLCLLSSRFTVAQTLSLVDTGWSSTSVNAVVFRKNSVVTLCDTQFVAYYDAEGFLRLAKRKTGTAKWVIQKTSYKGNVRDAHNSISIMVDGNGYLHVALDHHNSPLHYFRSIVPGSLELGTSEKMTGLNEEIVSYPEFYRFPNGDLLFLYRSGESGNGNLVMNYYNCKEKNWERLHNVLIDGQGIRNAYWQAFVDASGAIHLSWVWRETPDVATNHDMCYAISTDKGKTWKKSNGEIYSLPITQETAEIACRIPQGSELINQTCMYADSENQPYIATYFKTDNVPQYQLIYKNRDRWKCTCISNRKASFSLSGMGTKKIPISRPQLVVSERENIKKAMLVYRGAESGNRVSLALCDSFPGGNWKYFNLTNFSVGDWEPSYDTELWKKSQVFHLFVQYVGQGDAETLTDTKPQPIYILELDSDNK